VVDVKRNKRRYDTILRHPSAAAMRHSNQAPNANHADASAMPPKNTSKLVYTHSTLYVKAVQQYDLKAFMYYWRSSVSRFSILSL
jgi:hypothetical protein